MKRVATLAASSIGAALLGAGCPTTNVVLGSDGVPGGFVGGIGSAGGAGGASGVGGIGGGAACQPSEDALHTCSAFLPASQSYGYHACLNAHDGVGGAPANQCEGYAPCSYQHEGCLSYYSSGAAGSDSGQCRGEPAQSEWLNDCGGFGYYGSDITAGAGGAGGALGGAGIGCDPALNHCTGGVGGEAGGIAGTSAGAGAGGVAGTVAGAGGAAGEIGGTGGGAGAGAGGEAGTVGGIGGAGSGADDAGIPADAGG